MPATASTSVPPLLSLLGVSKRFGGVLANNAIDLNVAGQSIHAILGENGAGKSTLMKLIYGVEHPDAGTILWKGRAVSLHSPADARKLGIGMVFQHFSLFETRNHALDTALSFSASGPIRFHRCLVVENLLHDNRDS